MALRPFTFQEMSLRVDNFHQPHVMKFFQSEGSVALNIYPPPSGYVLIHPNAHDHLQMLMIPSRVPSRYSQRIR
jgi:hypothetical protein